MLSNLNSILLTACSILLICLSYSYNKKVNEVNTLKIQLAQMQVKEFNLSSELSKAHSYNYETKKQLDNINYEKVSHLNLPNTPCIDSDSLQELNNYISSTSSSKP